MKVSTADDTENALTDILEPAPNTNTIQPAPADRVQAKAHLQIAPSDSRLQVHTCTQQAGRLSDPDLPVIIIVRCPAVSDGGRQPGGGGGVVDRVLGHQGELELTAGNNIMEVWLQ